MSIWTHVAGIVRFDALRHVAPSASLGLTKKIVEEDAPGGSEGGLDFAAWENPHETALSAYAISMHGDLRDFGGEYVTQVGLGEPHKVLLPKDIGSIKAWMEKIVERANHFRMAIRQFVVSTEVEFLGTYTWVAVTDGEATARVRFVETFEPYKDS